MILSSIIGEGCRERMCRLMQTTPIEGCVVEVGVYKGGSLLDLYTNSQGRSVFGYDTFTGIPYRDEGDAHLVGDFKDTDYEAICDALPGVTVVKGVFPDSAVEMPPVSFVHLDVDQYRSYVNCISYLKPRMISKGIMWFDDMDCLECATRAVREMIHEHLYRDECGKWYAVF